MLSQRQFRWSLVLVLIVGVALANILYVPAFRLVAGFPVHTSEYALTGPHTTMMVVMGLLGITALSVLVRRHWHFVALPLILLGTMDISLFLLGQKEGTDFAVTLLGGVAFQLVAILVAIIFYQKDKSAA